MINFLALTLWLSDLLSHKLVLTLGEIITVKHWSSAQLGVEY